MYHIGCARYCPEGIDPRDESQTTRKVRLVYIRSELIYDISNCAYVEGHVMGDDRTKDADHARHTLMDIVQDGNIDRVSRILDAVHAAVVEMLYPYTKMQPCDDIEIVDDLQRDPQEYVIDMTVPLTFSRTTTQLLSRLIHEYMVYRVMHDWMSMTCPQGAQHWLDKAKEIEEQINSIKNLRTGTLTRPARPF